MSGCKTNSTEKTNNEGIEDIEPTLSVTEKAWLEADSIMTTLSLEERVGQCFMPAIYSSSDENNKKNLKRYISDLHVGGILLLKGDTQSAKELTGLKESCNIPLFVAIDAEWGLGMRLKDAPNFPINGNIADEVDEGVLYDYGREVARECRELGINMILGPVIDVVEGKGGVIGKRSFGSDPVRVADLGVAYAKGVESYGVISVAKHFPGHGASKVDSHVRLPVVSKDKNSLDSIDIYPFRNFINSGLNGIMVGHLSIPSLDSIATPATVSERIMDGLLRNDLNFTGLIMTDALNMRGIAGYSAADAISAGADLIIAPTDTAEEIRNVIDRITDGDIDLEIINDRCRRILFYKLLISDEDGERVEPDYISPLEIASKLRAR